MNDEGVMEDCGLSITILDLETDEDVYVENDLTPNSTYEFELLLTDIVNNFKFYDFSE